MNIILFDPEEIGSPLLISDPRAIHLIDTLRMRTGDDFDAGVVNGPRGKARIVSIDEASITFESTLDVSPLPQDPLDIIVGLPRPQSARRILHDAAALGLRRLVFTQSARSDPNYARSTLWSSGEWRRHLIDGAQQAFDTRIPEVIPNLLLAEATARSNVGLRIAFDNYEAPTSLPALLRSRSEAPQTVTLAFGPERGWDAADREMLRASGFALASLGHRVMRVETAIASAVAVLRAELGWT
ncbi:MAG TPA: RsmE family RNA methyltransferase [Opitutaceae bacterium]|nr:RsmE family RNA methyltransferase [Opitutaceae bacterium]